jgi:hypothetical protein
MSIDGWLVLDIALGILVGDLLRVVVKDTDMVESPTRGGQQSRRVSFGRLALLVG